MCVFVFMYLRHGCVSVCLYAYTYVVKFVCVCVCLYGYYVACVCLYALDGVHLARKVEEVDLALNPGMSLALVEETTPGFSNWTNSL